jgi:hypothetical protein
MKKVEFLAEKAISVLQRLGSFISWGFTRTIRRINSWKGMGCACGNPTGSSTGVSTKGLLRLGLFVGLGLFICYFNNCRWFFKGNYILYFGVNYPVFILVFVFFLPLISLSVLCSQRSFFYELCDYFHIPFYSCSWKNIPVETAFSLFLRRFYSLESD